MVRKKISKKKLIFSTIFILSVLFILTFYIWHQTESIRLGYENGVLEEKILSLKKDVELLEAQRASLLNLERVEKIAKEELNLHEPQENQIQTQSPNPESEEESL